MPPEKRTIEKPKTGWKECAYYAVDIAFNRFNPVHRAIFYTGFLDKKGLPAGYNQVWNPTGDNGRNINDLYYLKVIRKPNVGETK